MKACLSSSSLAWYTIIHYHSGFTEIYICHYVFQETQVIGQRNNNLNEYYESLRNNVITLLEHVRLPNGSGGGQEKLGHENFDTYLSKLQTLCTPDGYCSDESNRPLYETVKSALQDFTVLPTPI
jgi:hypothetical protein